NTSADTYTVKVTVTDDEGVSGYSTTQLTVTNVAPVVTSVSNNSPDCGDVMQGQPVSATVNFTDVGTLDGHTLKISWGDGNTTTATQVGTGSGSITGSHVYAAGGVYTITLTLSDDDGAVVAAGTTKAVVSGVGLAANGTLFIIGTGAADQVSVNM